MPKSKLWLIPSVGALVVLACHEVDGPIARSLQVPVRVSGTVGPPALKTYIMSSAGSSYVELTSNNFLWDTWILVEPQGPTFMIYAESYALPATGPVGSSGVAGGRNGCDLYNMVWFGQYPTGFGQACGSGGFGSAVVRARGQGFIKQGSFPYDATAPDNSDCPPRTFGSCHTQDTVDLSFKVTTIPAVIRPLKSHPRTVPFSSVQYAMVTFTTGVDPETFLMGGVLRTMPFVATSWVYTASDGTLDGNPCGTGPACSPYLHKAGRMVVKAFIAGWEQTSTISVQCLVTPGDSVLNDTTSDFAVRDSILKMLVRANADSAPEKGFDISHPGWTGGWQHETGVNVWQLPDGAGREIDNVTPFFSDACTMMWVNEPPVPDATLLGHFHAHETKDGDPMYCRTTVKRRNGKETAAATSPDEAAQGRPIAFAPPDTAADRADRRTANRTHAPNYVLTWDKRILKISPVADDSLPNPQTWYRAAGGTTAQQKCAWPKPKS